MSSAATASVPVARATGAKPTSATNSAANAGAGNARRSGAPPPAPLKPPAAGAAPARAPTGPKGVSVSVNVSTPSAAHSNSTGATPTASRPGTGAGGATPKAGGSFALMSPSSRKKAGKAVLNSFGIVEEYVAKTKANIAKPLTFTNIYFYIAKCIQMKARLNNIT